MKIRSPEPVRFVDLGAQYRSIEPEIREALRGVLENSEFILGPRLAAFERRFAEFVGARHAVGLGSGLEALRLPLLALGIGPGDEVIVPASTFIATALAVSFVGAKPVLADCDPGTYNFDVAAVRAAVTPRTRALLPVHLGGLSADMEPLLELARAKNLLVIEDAAQAHGALYRGRACGSMGAAGAFSFYPGKNLGAYGDGGMVVTNDAGLARRLRLLRHYGQRLKNVHDVKGGNARLDTLQAAVLEVKLKRLPAWNAARAAHARMYRERLSGIGDLGFQETPPGLKHVYHLLMVETDRRDELQGHLERSSIETGIHYPRPIHLQPAYRELGLREGDFPVAERRARRTLSLPMFPELSERQIERVCGAVKAFFQKKQKKRKKASKKALSRHS